MTIAIASCRVLPEPDVDEALLVAKLTERGHDARVLAWDDPEARFDECALVVLRSTWNYYDDVDGFVAWVERTAATTRLFNPASIVRANVRKTYLRDLEERGIDVVPTRFVMRGERGDVAGLVRETGWDSIVVKPVVSAGSYQTKRFGLSDVDAAQRFLDELSAKRDMMIQRFMPSVETYGERSLVWIDGALTHAIRKAPRLADGHESVSGEVPIADDERAFAERILAPVADALLYARVDVVRDEDGVLRLMELELVEPSLFFKQAPRALERFVAALEERLGGTR